MNGQHSVSSSLFVDPSIPTRDVNNRKKRRYNEVREDEILAFGYEIKIYNDADLARKVDQGKFLIPWKSCNSSRITMDRFDVRHLIQDQDLFRVTQKSVLEKEYDSERYTDLVGEGISIEGRTNHKAAIPYDYGKSDRKEETTAKRCIPDFEKRLREKYNVPESIAVPKTTNQIELIQTISKEICSAKNPNLLEIHIQVKNANNVLYSFLNKQDPLYQFYMHLRSKITDSKSIKKSLVVYSDSSSSDNSDDEEDGGIPTEMKMIIQKTALTIANSSNSVKLEEYLRLQKGHESKFSFLNRDNIYFDYFKSQIKEKQQALE